MSHTTRHTHTLTLPELLVGIFDLIIWAVVIAAVLA